MQVICGFVVPNEGTVVYSENAQNLAPEQIKNKIALASPYLQLIEDFSLVEMVEHAASFKPFGKGMGTEQFLQTVQLESSRHKLIKQFSSGMKQRLKLGLALLSEAPVLFLDEPVSNLDKQAINWYKEMVVTYSSEKTVIVCSNAIDDEFFFCDRQLNLSDFKGV